MSAMARRKLSSLKGLEKSQAALLAAGMPDMIRWLRSKKKAKLLMDEVRKEIFELGPPTPPAKPTGRIRYSQWLHHHSSEIARALDTMKDVKFYIGRFPCRKTQISKHRHLQFHVEAFLHELYILQQRLLQFLVFIEPSTGRTRACRESRPRAACSRLRDRFNEEGDRDSRQPCAQVEDVRHKDRALAGNQVLHARPPSSELTRVFNAFYEAEYKKTRNQWRGWITDGIAEAQNLVNVYFDEVFKLLFDDRGKLTYPSRLKF
jgi:hypothetical protein